MYIISAISGDGVGPVGGIGQWLVLGMGWIWLGESGSGSGSDDG